MGPVRSTIATAATCVLLGLLAAKLFSPDAASDAARTSPGIYPPVPSLAGELGPQQAAFMARVDRICGTEFNKGLLRRERAEYLAKRNGLSSDRIYALAWHIDAVVANGQYRHIRALGPPPQRPALYRRWLENFRRRSILRERISRAIARGDARAQWLDGDRLDAMKIEFNHQGQLLGSRICTSNGPGREPGEYPADSDEAKAIYLRSMNCVCAQRNRTERRLESQRRLTASRTIGLDRAETLDLAALGPPLGGYALRGKILAVKRRFDRYWLRFVSRVNRSEDKDSTFRRLTPAWVQVARHTQARLRALGLPACSNWGPNG
jgi:hypothetical protein